MKLNKTEINAFATQIYNDLVDKVKAENKITENIKTFKDAVKKKEKELGIDEFNKVNKAFNKKYPNLELKLQATGDDWRKGPNNELAKFKDSLLKNLPGYDPEYHTTNGYNTISEIERNIIMAQATNKTIETIIIDISDNIYKSL